MGAIRLPWRVSGRIRGKRSLQVGLEISPTRISLAALQRPAGALPCLQHCVELKDFEQTDAALADLVKARGLRGCAAVLVLQPGDYQRFYLERPPVPEAELADALRWAVAEHIDYDPQQAVLDWYTDPAGQQAVARVHVVISPLSRVQALAKQVQACGLRLQALDIPELALRNVAAQLAQPGQLNGLLHVQGNSALLALVKDQQLFLGRPLALLADHEPTLMGAKGVVAANPLLGSVRSSLHFHASRFGTQPVQQLTHAVASDTDSAYVAGLEQAVDMPVAPLKWSAGIEQAQRWTAVQLNDSLRAIGGALRQECS